MGDGPLSLGTNFMDPINTNNASRYGNVKKKANRFIILCGAVLLYLYTNPDIW